MWDLQWMQLAERHEIVRYDARGFGDTEPPRGPWAQHRDLAEVVDELHLEAIHLVGGSMGAGTAVEFALARPDAVRSLFLVAPAGALFGAPPDAVRALWRDEGDALDRGDVDAAVEVNLKAWVDGPSRDPTAVDPAVRAFVALMQRHAFESQAWDDGIAPEVQLDPPASERLGELHLPILVLVGEADQPAVLAVAERLATEGGARLVRWPSVAHLPSLERPDDFTRLVIEFLSGVDAAAVAP